ncbi:MAG: hypothetical protein LW854_19775 [Rubrivivax sp.]|jgi:hypothetical protein|uniref:hypothetical protein n=1 Tax=Acidovorax sp. TaxID=1872122 RepID=UPI00391F5C7D|nr:hypothetical protein [Rubrivivax sp.]
MMNSIPTKLTDEDAQEITDLLREARKFLRDAVGGQMHQANYSSTVTRIALVLQRFEIEPA